MREIIMVCYGNICRSPMAEAMLQDALDRRLGPGHDVVVSSAGIAAMDGRPPSRGSVQAMTSRGLDIRSQRSAELTASMAKRAFMIFCMEDYQVEHIRKMLPPEHHGKVRTFGDEVPDPIGQGQFAYDAVAYTIERQIPAAVEDVVASLSAPSPAE